jgi:hypothetical protein
MDSVYFNTDGVVLTRKPVDTLDFRQGSWGHVLHSSTFREVEGPKNLIGRLSDRVRKVRRYSFIVHSGHHPRAGQRVIWKSAVGDIEGVLYDFECFANPRDQFKLFVEVTGPLPTLAVVS